MKFICRQWDWATSTWMAFTNEPVPNMVMGTIVPLTGDYVDQYNTNVKNQNLQLIQASHVGAAVIKSA